MKLFSFKKLLCLKPQQHQARNKNKPNLKYENAKFEVMNDFQKNIKLRKICYLRPDNIKCEKEVATIYKPSEDKLHNFRLKVTNN